MRLTKCDNCGKELASRGYGYNDDCSLTGRCNDAMYHVREELEFEYDFCRECYELISEVIKDAIK